MRTATLLRLGGAAAIAGGVLRTAGAFTTGLPNPQLLAIFYFVTDVFLLFGLTGWYLSRASGLGWSGVVGYAASVIAILIIRTDSLFGPQGYALGAVIFLLGLAIMSMPSLWRRGGNLVPPLLWLGALAVGIASLAAPILAVLAGVLFGLGFVAAGVALWRMPATDRL